MRPNRVLAFNLPSEQEIRITLSDTSQAYTSSNNRMAYRPRYADNHNSGVGVLFLNMEEIFPCLKSASRNLMCGRITNEEDGFFRGKSFLQAADSGNNFRIFSSTDNIYTYGLAVEGCAEFTSECFPDYAEVTVFCLLPRQLCA